MSVISDVPFFDLRNIKTVEEALVISEISDVPVVIMPKERQPELMRALRNIDMNDVAYTLHCDDDAVIRSINGICELTKDNFYNDKRMVYVINGVCFVHDLDGTEMGDILINGILIIAQGDRARMNIDLPLVNGRTEYVDAVRSLSFENNLYITLEFLKYIKSNTLIVSGNKIEIAPDVKASDLDEAKVTLLATNKIGCDKRLIPYIQAKGIYGNKVYAI